jgi:signal transduction histidine kinase
VSRFRPLLLVLAVSIAGAIGTLIVGSFMGMGGGELRHLGFLLVPGIIATIVAAAAAGPLLTRSSVRVRLSVIAIMSAVIALANLLVLTRLMFLSDHDAGLLRILLLYSAGAGIGAALALGRSSDAAVGRLVDAAKQIAAGDLEVRVGDVTGGGRELDQLAHALDDMIVRLRSSIERERGVERMRRDLFGAVSHDLRTPLSGLRAMIEAIDEGVVDQPQDLRRYAARMRTAVHALGRLVDDLFELVELDEGAIEADPERVRLEDVITSAVAACEGQALEKGLSVRTDEDGAGAILCSPRMIRVLQNLLQNAIRHTPTHGEIFIAARRKDPGAEIVVADTGIGIDPESLDRIFEPFWRADPARSGGGSGLGLALAKRVVESLGGNIHVESVVGEGAVFKITLPVDQH